MVFCPAGSTDAIQQRLGGDVVLRLVGDHRVDVVRHAGARRAAQTQPVKTRAKLFTVVLPVGRDRLTSLVELLRAIRIQPDRADREELEDLARVVLVGPRARVAVHVEVVAHRRVERDLVEQVAIVAEGVAVEDLEVRRHPARLR